MGVFTLPGLSLFVPVGVVSVLWAAPTNGTTRAVHPVPVVIGNMKQDESCGYMVNFC
jgi:hypothetical protein